MRMRVPIKAHYNAITDEMTFEYADISDKTVTDLFLNLYQAHLEHDDCMGSKRQLFSE